MTFFIILVIHIPAIRILKENKHLEYYFWLYPFSNLCLFCMLGDTVTISGYPRAPRPSFSTASGKTQGLNVTGILKAVTCKAVRVNVSMLGDTSGAQSDYHRTTPVIQYYLVILSCLCYALRLYSPTS